MALPKRNRRKICVDGTDYYWVKGSRGDNGRGVAAVQHSSGTGSRLMIDPYGTIMYDMIDGAIRFALEAGWQPLDSGPEFWIGFANTLDDQARFVVRKATDPPYWSDPTR